MNITFAPTPDGTQWQVLAEKATSTLYRITVDHADLDVVHDPHDLTALEQAVLARALALLAAGEATVIGEEKPPIEITSWEMDGSGHAREALEFHTQRVTGEDAR
ncbi:hypothetical protein [Actinokineospora enzanensis]|uniref:hypothetical protein n=1 Tax=Actinokineospora enzanensis TaxID=155975 RepID=UPI000376266E|nr:hypothetical protein [Actinokineospora enzanensis]